ncbi:Neurotrypsin [Mizuhopecten yessoensis]|uniref:Neurotrypsin n=1 Tax=Mizuhopecten yessoensis TaxID=6573 RepID=A0A210QNF3_MIZYE|nr:Neurotrypsin [Mizuhopecten yessoensis]
MVRLDADERKRRSAGYLNIHHRGSWLNICADNWTTQNTNVACRQLGHASGQVAPPTSDPKTVEVDKLWLRNITCSGSEMRLDACEHVIWSRGCESNMPVRISCT